MRMTRHQFMILLAGIMGLAFVLAMLYRQEASHEMPADLAYLLGLVFVEHFFLRAEAWAGALVTLYCGSLLFCFFYLFVAPLEAPLMLLLFFWPTYLWQKKRIKGRPFLGLGLLLMVVCWKVVNRPAVPVLLFPVLQLVAMRVAGRVQPRYSRFTSDLGVSLSQAQKQQQRDPGWVGEGDWFDLLQAEFEKFPQRVGEVWQAWSQDGPRRPVDEESGPDARLLQIQDPARMSDALTDLTRRDRPFRIDAFLKRVESVFWKVQDAWYGQNLEPIEPLVADALFEQFRLQIEEQRAAGIRFRHAEMTVFENRPAQVNTGSGFDVLHVYLRASSANSLMDLTTGETLAEEDHRRQFSEYWTFLRRPTAQTLAKPGLFEGHCPSCSAPLQIGQATVCQVCRSFIRSGSYDWVLAKITQACEWEYVEPDQVPGWNRLVADDPALTMQQIEDRGGVLFWRFRQAERQQKADPIARFATPEFCRGFASRLGKPQARGWSFMENVAIGSIRLRQVQIGEQTDRVYLLVIWSGIPVVVGPDGKALRDRQIPSLIRDVFVLARQHGQKTDDRVTLTSAHCPSCGGPLASSFSATCSYCDTVLNEGTAGWILERVCSEFDPALRAHAPAPEGKAVPARVTPARRLDLGTDLVFVMIQILLADGRIDPRELSTLREAATRQGIGEARLQAMIAEVQDGRVHIPDVRSGADGQAVLQAAARMALADGVLDPAEEGALRQVARVLGYSEADLKRALGQERKRAALENPDRGPAAVGRAETGATETPMSPRQQDGAVLADTAAASGAPDEPTVPDGAIPLDLAGERIPKAAADVLTVMVQVLLADGAVGPAERTMLVSFGARNGVSAARLGAMIEAARNGSLRIPTPATPREALDLLTAAVRMARADGVLSPEEEKVLNGLAIHLGYSGHDLKRIMAREKP